MQRRTAGRADETVELQVAVLSNECFPLAPLVRADFRLLEGKILKARVSFEAMARE